MADLRKHSSTSNLFRVVLKNSSTGVGLTGLSDASAGLIIATIADNESATTRYLASSSEIETISTLGTFAAPTSGKCRFKEVDATNHPGLYEIQLADARASVASAKRLVVSISGATNLLPADYEIQLTQVDPYDATRAGLAALPNAAAEASGGLPTLSAAQGSNGTIQANVHRWLTGTPNALTSGRVEVLVGAVTNGVIAAASFAANALDAVWSTATRVLTAGTNIVLAKGTGVTGFNDLSAAQVNAEADTALADAGVTTTVTGRIDVAVSTRAPESGGNLAAVKAKTDNLPTDPADASDIAASFSTVASTLATIAGYIDTEVAAIKAKTDNLPSDPADQSAVEAAITAAVSALSTAAALASVASNVTAIKAKTDNLPEGVKTNQALNNFEFFMVDSADHVTGKTGLTVTAQRSIDGGAFAACANAVVEVGLGVYKINLSAADLNGTNVMLLFSASGADDTPISLKTAA